MSGSLARATRRASPEATSLCFRDLSRSTHGDGSIGDSGRDSHGPATSDPDERTYSSRVAQPAAGLSYDPQEGRFETQSPATSGMGDDAPTDSGCISTPTSARPSIRTNSLTGCGEAQPAGLRHSTEAMYVLGMKVEVNPTVADHVRRKCGIQYRLERSELVFVKAILFTRDLATVWL